MRLINITAPVGQGEKIVQIALECGVTQVSVHQVKTYKKDRSEQIRDVVEFNCSTPVMKTFIDALTSAPFFSSESITFSIKQPRSIITSNIPSEVTLPFVMPSTDIYEELWQFSHVTFSFVGRILIAALLLSYGMIHDHLLLMIAGLLFLPLQPTLLAVAFGACIKEWRLLGQGVYATATAIVLIIGAGALVAWIAGPPLAFQTFGSPESSFLISCVLGIAAALATADDVGRRELIGLAVTAQLAVLPAWIGISLIFGFPESHVTLERILTFGMILGTIMLTAGITYALMGIRGRGILRYVNCTKGKCPVDEQGQVFYPGGRQAVSK